MMIKKKMVNTILNQMKNIWMFGLWSSISLSAREVANQLNVEGLNLGEGEGDGLAALSEKAKREKSVRFWIWE